MNSIAAYKTYTIEVKEDGKEFEEYNADIINIYVCIWKDDYKEKNEGDIIWDTLSISKKAKQSELKKRLYEIYNIPEEKEIFVFKKFDFAQNNYNIVELMAKPEDINKELFMSAIFDAQKVYVEVKEYENDKFNSKFLSFFGDKVSNITIRFNFPVTLVPGEKVKPSQYKWDNEIEVKNYWTLKQVKEKIAEFLNLNENEFIMKKFSHNGTEIRNLKEKVSEITNNNMNVFTEFGTPLGEGKYILI
jgi:hypothetical protein